MGLNNFKKGGTYLTEFERSRPHEGLEFDETDSSAHASSSDHSAPAQNPAKEHAEVAKRRGCDVFEALEAAENEAIISTKRQRTTRDQIHEECRKDKRKALHAAFIGNPALCALHPCASTLATRVESNCYKGIHSKQVYLQKVSLNVQHIKKASMTDLRDMCSCDSACLKESVRFICSHADTDTESCLKCLEGLIQWPGLNVNLLSSSDAAKAIKQLTKHSNASVSAAARKVVRSWKDAVLSNT